MSKDLHFTIKEDKIYMLKDMPNPEKYGFENSVGFDSDRGGWQIEGGEEAYYEAFQKAIDNAVLVSNQNHIRLNILVAYEVDISKGCFFKEDTIYTLSGYKVEIKKELIGDARKFGIEYIELAVISPVEPEEIKL